VRLVISLQGVESLLPDTCYRPGLDFVRLGTVWAVAALAFPVAVVLVETQVSSGTTAANMAGVLDSAWLVFKGTQADETTLFLVAQADVGVKWDLRGGDQLGYGFELFQLRLRLPLFLDQAHLLCLTALRLGKGHAADWRAHTGGHQMPQWGELGLAHFADLGLWGFGADHAATLETAAGST